MFQDVVQLAVAYLGLAVVIGGTCAGFSAVTKFFKEMADDSPLDLS